MPGVVHRPIPWTRRAVVSAVHAIARRITVDFRRFVKGPQLEMEMAQSPISASQDMSEQLATRQMISFSHDRVEIEMPIHRIELIGMLNQHHQPWIVRSRVDDRAVSHGIHWRATCFPVVEMPVLARVPPAG